MSNRVMNQRIFRLLSLTLGLAGFHNLTPAIAAPLSSALDSSCWQALNQVKTEISGVVDQPIFNTTANAHDYQFYPAGRPLQLNLGIGGPHKGVNTPTYWQISNFMSSPVLQQTLAQKLIQDCQNISSVGFGMAYTDWGNVYGLTRDSSQIIPFRPVSPPCRNLNWGEYCQP